MGIDRTAGTTPLDGLRTYLEDGDLACDACGYEDEGGEWSAATSGRRIVYRHRCPRCGARRTRTFDLGA